MNQGMEALHVLAWQWIKPSLLATSTYRCSSAQVMAADNHHPASWCVAGNCYSLHKDHDAAIKHFERAIQIDPGFTYAYTLLGHECIANDDIQRVSLR